MSVSAREIGTLIVVVLKARNLPNKRHIGKQAPYCLLTHSEDKRRTRVIRRGGQHPEWDEEFRFTICEDMETENFAQAGDTPPPLPPKRSKGPKNIKGGSFMKLQCYADDAREPDFIGETLVDLTEALTKGETDEWFTLMNRDKYAGEVYLELTFWSNEPPPEKKDPRKSTMLNKSYGGPGSFVPTDGSSQSLNSSGIFNMSSQGGDSEASHLNSLPPSLRSSASRPPLYAPHYEQHHHMSTGTLDQLTDDFSELGMLDSRRRESYPPSSTTLRPSTLAGPSSRHLLSLQDQTGDSGIIYDDVTTPTSATALVRLPQHYTPYESITDTVYSRNTGPRHSLPLPSPGFTPVPTSSSAVAPYGGMSTYSSEPSGFTVSHDHSLPPPSSPHPVPPANFHSQFHHRSQTTFVTASTTPTTSVTTNVSSIPSHRVLHSMTPPQLHTCQQYPHPSEQAVPFPSNVLQEYVDLPSVSMSLQVLPVPPARSTPPQVRSRHASVTPSPPRECFPLGAVHIPPTSTGSGSRPLPQPGQFQRDRRLSMAASTFTSGSSYSSALPPIPPYRRVPSAQSAPPLPPTPHELLNPHIPSLPNPEVRTRGNGSPARPPLPQPPVGPHSASTKFQAMSQIPLPQDISVHGDLPSSSFGNTTYFPSRPLQLHTNYGQNLPPSSLPAEWQ